MKKISLIASLLLVFTCFSFAQTTPAAATKKPATTTTAATTPATTTHLKKDGTPDKRFKENKTPPAHLKKDGTPDMRYKENKKTTPAPAAATPKKSS